MKSGLGSVGRRRSGQTCHGTQSANLVRGVADVCRAIWKGCRLVHVADLPGGRRPCHSFGSARRRKE